MRFYRCFFAGGQRPVSGRGVPKTAYQAPVMLRASAVCRPQLDRKIGDAIETSCNCQHLLPGPGIVYRFAEGTDLLGMAEPELSIK